ncbi:5235_t:CDS:2 [Dentiscutata erythropus]|uniref:5235_t:CDS:1 n=1 Tax=Dentiscutata erythropus TaxID=1348616 RepID=A0A9N8WPS8_9GLOM|nr:5235_t:CDS:2 [Dentiscutata erythropus]
MSKKPPAAKPVNDLIRFWAAQQEEKAAKTEPSSRSPRRPLSPTQSTQPTQSIQSTPSSPKGSEPLSPRSWITNSPFGSNLASAPPPLSPTQPLPPPMPIVIEKNSSLANKSVIADRLNDIFGNNVETNEEKTINADIKSDTSKIDTVKNNNNSITPVEKPFSPKNTSFSELGSPTRTVPPKDISFLTKTRDAKTPVQRETIPQAKKVSNLVSQFEKAVTPPTSPTALSPVKRFNTIPDPLNSSSKPIPQPILPPVKQVFIEISPKSTHNVNNVGGTSGNNGSSSNNGGFNTNSTNTANKRFSVNVNDTPLTRGLVTQNEQEPLKISTSNIASDASSESSGTSTPTASTPVSTSPKKLAKRRSRPLPRPLSITTPVSPKSASSAFIPQTIPEILPITTSNDESKILSSASSLKLSVRESASNTEAVSPMSLLFVDGLPQIQPSSPLHITMPEPLFTKHDNYSSSTISQISQISQSTYSTSTQSRRESIISSSRDSTIKRTNQQELTRLPEVSSQSSGSRTHIYQTQPSLSDVSDLSFTFESTIQQSLKSDTRNSVQRVLTPIPQIRSKSPETISIKSTETVTTKGQGYSELVLPEIKQTSPMWGPLPNNYSPPSPIHSFTLSDSLYSVPKSSIPETRSITSAYSTRSTLPELLPEIKPTSPMWGSNKDTNFSFNDDLLPQATPISPIKFDIPELGLLEPLAKVQQSSTHKDHTSTAPLKRELPDPLSNTYTSPNLISDGDKNNWGFWNDSPPESPNKFKLDLDRFNNYLSKKDPDGDHGATGLKKGKGRKYSTFLDKTNIDHPDVYKVKAGTKLDKHKSLPLTQDDITHKKEIHETRMESDKMDQSDDYINSEDNNIPIFQRKQTRPSRKSIPNFYPSKSKKSKLTDEQPHGMTIKLRKSGNFQTFPLSDGSKIGAKRQKCKPIQILKFPYSTIRPQRNTLSSASALKKNPFLKSIKRNFGDRNLPEYTLSKSKMSFMVPHNLASVEFGKLNHSVPDLTVRVRHQKFSEAYRKINMTVPDFTRFDSVMKDFEGKKKTEFNIQIMNNDLDSDPSKITKFSINPFDESESNELFKSGSPWIHLPHLDEFIKSLPQSDFSNPKDLMTQEEYENFITSSNKLGKYADSLFPPLNQIPDEVSLDELKSNITSKEKSPMHNDLISTAIDGVLIAEASAFGNTFMKLEILRDFIQFLTLALAFGSAGTVDGWLKILLNTIPNFLTLYWFRMMTKWDPNADAEGLETFPWNLRPQEKRRHNIVIVFILTTLYLPLSKLSIDALVWSKTFWPVGNGQNVCYVTSMRNGDLNFSPAIIVVALIVLGVFTIWFPIALKRLVDKNYPKIDRFNEAGEKITDEIKEYSKRLEDDLCPYNFLYNGYSEKWAAYKTFIMGNKFLSILLISTISEENCIFHSTHETTSISLARQSLQIFLMLMLLFIHWRSEPFLHHSQNISEYLSRSGYVIAAILGIFVVLKIGDYYIVSIILVIINLLIGLLVVWHLFKQTNGYKRFVKNMKKRLDFSLNIYSPKLDFSKHIKRRVWQETWTALILTSDQLKIPPGKVVAYSQSSHRPPYLLNFSGSVAERHVENLKIMKQIGIKKYTTSLAPLPISLEKLRLKIVNNFVGPDMYYAPEFLNINIKTYFGKAYVVPFPFSVVMCYDDDDSIVVLTQEWEIRRYVEQNENKEIQRRRLVRQMIRSLEGKIILGPCCAKEVHYHRGLLQIRRNQRSKWRGQNMNSGFEIAITYSDRIKTGSTSSSRSDSSTLSEGTPFHEITVGHNIIGITADFQMTPQLERLFTDNYETLSKGLDLVQAIMQQYRDYYKDEAVKKMETLTYGFFINVFDNPSIPLESLPALLMATETNEKVRSIPETEYSSLIYLYERMRIINLSRVHQWWYLFWEDLWRKNHKEIEDLKKYPQDFSPSYRTSLCYRPMIRLELEEFLQKRGLWKNEGRDGFLHSGILNRIYLYLNNVVFGRNSGSKRKNNKGGVEEMPRTWSIVKGNSIDSNEYTLREKDVKTIKDRMLIMKDLVLRRETNLSRTRPFFVLKDEYVDIDDDESEGINSSSDEETCINF